MTARPSPEWLGLRRTQVKRIRTACMGTWARIFSAEQQESFVFSQVNEAILIVCSQISGCEKNSWIYVPNMLFL